MDLAHDLEVSRDQVALTKTTLERGFRKRFLPDFIT